MVERFNKGYIVFLLFLGEIVLRKVMWIKFLRKYFFDDILMLYEMVLKKDFISLSYLLGFV